MNTIHFDLSIQDSFVPKIPDSRSTFRKPATHHQTSSFFETWNRANRKVPLFQLVHFHRETIPCHKFLGQEIPTDRYPLSHLSKDSKLHRLQGNEFDRVTGACGVEEAANRVNKRDTRCTHDYNILVILFSRVRNGPLREPNDLFSPCAAQPAGRPLTYLCFMLYLSRTGVPCCLLAGLCCAFHFALLVRRSCNAIVPCPLNNDRDC